MARNYLSAKSRLPLRFVTQSPGVYAIQVFSGMEMRALEALRQADIPGVGEFCLGYRSFYDADGSVACEPLFKSYIFVELMREFNSSIWHAIRRTLDKAFIRGVRILASAPVTPEEIAQLKELAEHYVEVPADMVTAATTSEDNEETSNDNHYSTADTPESHDHCTPNLATESIAGKEKRIVHKNRTFVSIPSQYIREIYQVTPNSAENPLARVSGFLLRLIDQVLRM